MFAACGSHLRGDVTTESLIPLGKTYFTDDVIVFSKAFELFLRNVFGRYLMPILEMTSPV
jgi:hypothetical protein